MYIPEELQAKLKAIDSVATLPNIATDILSLMRSREASMRQIADVIEKDPPVTTKILKVANSPLWGYTGRVESVQRALVLMGLKQVSNIVIAVSLYSTFAKLKPNPLFDRKRFWMHSVGTAQIARKLARAIDLNFQGQEFVAGLIHDLGKMILDQFLGSRFQEIIQKAHEKGIAILEGERAALKCTHAEIGARLLEIWNFPSSYVEVLQYHHFPALADHSRELVAVVSVADTLCELWGIGFDEDIKYSCIEEEEGWQILKTRCPKMHTFDLERFTFEIATELEKARLFVKLMND